MLQCDEKHLVGWLQHSLVWFIDNLVVIYFYDHYTGLTALSFQASYIPTEQ